MKIVRYEHRGTVGYGLWREGFIHPVAGRLFDSLSETGERLPEAEVRLLSPLRPNKLIAIGLNYREHAKEQGKPLPEEPLLFLVSPTAVVGPGDAIRLPTLEHRIDHEAELAVVIGRGGKDIPREKAEEYIFGYTCANDVSNRVLQARDGQNTRAKSFDTFKPLGPAIATELDPSDLSVCCRVNGEIRQDGRTSDMIHTVPALVEFISSVFPLEPGDVILTGTPSGVGPLRPGDLVEVTVEGIGTLSNRVEAE